MAELVFLGTAAALPTATRANTALAILPGDAAPGLLVDCGGDIYRALLKADLAGDALSDLFITHAHIDHIGSLPSLLEGFRLGGRSAALRIWGLSAVLAVAHRLIAAFDFELTLDTWSFPVAFAPVAHGDEIRLAGIAARVVAMDHTVPSAGLRLDLPGGALAYTCDTQPNANIATLGEGARLLITECTYLRAQEPYARISKHMTAYEAGQQAATCAADRLALVHLGVGDALDAARSEAAESFSGAVLIPNDGDRIAL